MDNLVYIKKRIAIIFMEGYVLYSPYLLNLIQSLSVKAEVFLIISKQIDLNVRGNLDPTHFLPQSINVGDCFLNRILYKCKERCQLLREGVFKKQLYRLLCLIQIVWLNLKIAWTVKRINPHRLLVVDYSGLVYSRACFLPKHFISLELFDGITGRVSKYRKQISSVLSQSDIRIDLLLPNWERQKFTAVNSRNYLGRVESQKNGLLIYSGGLTWFFGLRPILEYIQGSTEKIVLQGGIGSPDFMRELKADFGMLLENGQLILDSEYLLHSEVISYLAPFSIGFCFYDQSYPYMNSVNYTYGSPGKLYAYLAAGVPMVCSNLPGMQIVREYGCGVAVDSLSTDVIREAVQLIQNDYELYRENCFKAAEAVSFDRQITPYIDYLLETSDKAVARA